MFSNIDFKLKVDFECPELHYCKIFHSMADCQKEIDATINAVTKKCIETTSAFIGKKGNFVCGMGVCETTTENYVWPGPQSFVSVIQQQSLNKMELISIGVSVILVCVAAYAFYKGCEKD